MGFFNSWKGDPIICWAFDTPESWQKAIGEDYYKRQIQIYENLYNRNVSPILFDMGMKFNLGGEQEKSRLETTSRPIGVFDFSLASKGLYRVQEYYSEELAKDYPDLFKNLELPSGVVPPNLVENIMIMGVKNFIFKHDNKTFVLQKRQKGTTAINNGDKDAKLKFATTTKEVYLKFKRIGGKVKYAEIYSLFYYTSVNGVDEYAIRHLPALITAQYFESIGIKTRVYMTRFCNPRTDITLKKFDSLTNAELPMFSELVNYKGSDSSYDEIFFAPIIVKDFGQEINFVTALAVSQSDSSSLYRPIAEQMMENELVYNISPFGNPDQTQERYLEAFARYKQKYQTYVKAGIWKSKEIQEDSQLFFHSQSIRQYLTSTRQSFVFTYSLLGIQVQIWTQILQNSVVIRTFFEWWMQISAGRCRDTLMIMNAKEPRKEMQKVIDDLKQKIDDINSYLQYIVPQTYSSNSKQDEIENAMAKNIIKNDWVNRILEEEGLTIGFNNEYKFENYLNRLIQDSTTYASDPLFATEDDTIERLDERADLLYNDIKLRN